MSPSAGYIGSPAASSGEKSVLTTVTVLLVTLGAVRGAQVCYEPFGCFVDGKPWSGTFQRPLARLPQSPSQIDTRFFLWSREKPTEHQTLSAGNMTSITSSSFRSSRRTTFLIHGMADRARGNWLSDLCQEMVRAEDVHCIGVDWSRGSGNIATYPQAVANTRLVGAQIAHFIRTLREELDYPLSMIHLIGHSLGAHVAGYVGHSCPGLRRITGLDPARPYFEDTPELIRLDFSDALLVDVIHSDTGGLGECDTAVGGLLGGLGMVKAIGHLDFYPNGGQHMPGCPNKLTFLWNFHDLLNTVACNHFMAFRYYTHSLRRPSAFHSYPCDSYSKFTSGACFPCPPGGCPTMGHYAERFFSPPAPRHTLYLNTGGEPANYSRWVYKVSLKLMGSSSTASKIYVSLHGSEGNVTDHLMKSGTLTPGDTLHTYLHSPEQLLLVHHVTFRWVPHIYNFSKTQLGAARVTVQSGEGSRWSFCSDVTVLDDVRHVLGPCGDVGPL